MSRRWSVSCSPDGRPLVSPLSSAPAIVGRHEDGICYGGKRHEEDAALELVQQLGRNLQTEACLSRPSRPRERQETYPLVAQQPTDLGNLFLSSYERGRLDGQVVEPLVQGLQRWEAGGQVGGDKLEDPLRPDQVLEATLPQIPQSNPFRQPIPEQFPNSGGQQDLSAVGRCEEPRHPVEGRPEVVTSALGCGAGVQGHPHPQGSDVPVPPFGRELPLGLECRLQRV